MDASHAATAARIRVASAPCSFGVDEVLVDDTWMPGPDEMLGWMSDLAFEGTELGPPGFLGDGEVLRSRLEEHRLELVGTFLPQRFTDDVAARRPRVDARPARTVARGNRPEARPFAVLRTASTTPCGTGWRGRVASHPSPSSRIPHGQAGRERPSLRGGRREAASSLSSTLMPAPGSRAPRDRPARLRPGRVAGWPVPRHRHFRFGGADPVACLDAYRSIVRHVHVKDCRRAVIDEVASQEAGSWRCSPLGSSARWARGTWTSPASPRRCAGTLPRWVVIEQDQFLGPPRRVSRSSPAATEP